ncbi:malonyl-ACP O-methyltransferase BioC [Pseudoteredinibacter isoporae]|uniref:Malonyl-[acyl-carrier protein] O-methyltransferase n=1 Tax=Pseudoteredinibacter isoporae TaxID=570281 RepID=A0A7X0JRS3_9GAMM|nr:malonyl-ACP O-methyltransferase BioC [Pseudoteredinibacter isoporae]MBB6521090.1 malonyl-CoA O-methyltransferase [Pseudoteredinibacter isoporae]NHO86654.1 malonyl-ACP O-methyltransferase BioC [Pseudoteredinibacter isoporae]NIB24894.1 malonyl-ACP O-methyltransferase BioC [Pseudoteredinibacter isoporae]
MNSVAANVPSMTTSQRISIECVAYPALSDDADHYVLIHGWGLGRDVWHRALPQLRHVNVHCISLPGFDQSPATPYRLADLLNALEEVLPESCHLVGYSLGGLLAQAFLSSKKVLSVTCLAAGPRFVASSDWPHAMAEDVFEEFKAFFERDPNTCLRRFMGLQSQGDAEQKKSLAQSLGLLNANGLNADYFSSPENMAVWQKALELLGEVDNRKTLFESHNKPVHFIFAEQDALVPVSVAKIIESWSLSHIKVSVVPGAHGLPSHLNQDNNIARLLEASQREDRARYRLDKSRIARSFSRAAVSYDSVAGLQRQVCEHLFQQLPHESLPDNVVLDLGSGTGYFSHLLAQRPEPEQPKQLFNLDLAEGMLRFSREQEYSTGQLSHWLAADAEALPLADNSVDCLFSSLAIQWCQQEDQLFSEIYRVLKPGAKAFIATLGPESLWQLRDAWAQVDDKVHVNRFTPWSDLKRSIDNAGLCSDIEKDEIVVRFDTFKQLRFDLKNLGAQNMNAGQEGGLSSRRRLEALLKAYEGFRQAKSQGGQLPLSYEVYYLQLEKPES